VEPRRPLWGACGSNRCAHTGAGGRPAHMMRRLLAPLGLLGLEATVLLVVVYLAPGRAAIAEHVFVVVVAAEALGAFSLLLARSLRSTEQSVFEEGLRRERRRAERGAQRVRPRNEVPPAPQSPLDLHARLVPT